MVAKYECSGVHGFTIRHVNCEVIVAQGEDACTSRCPSCTQYRTTLCGSVRRSNTIDLKASDWSNPSSHTTYRFYTSPEKVKRLENFVNVIQKDHFSVFSGRNRRKLQPREMYVEFVGIH